MSYYAGQNAVLRQLGLAKTAADGAEMPTETPPKPLRKSPSVLGRLGGSGLGAMTFGVGLGLPIASIMPNRDAADLVRMVTPAVGAGLANYVSGGEGPEAFLSGLGALVGGANAGVPGAMLGGVAGAGVGAAAGGLGEFVARKRYGRDPE